MPYRRAALAALLTLGGWVSACGGSASPVTPSPAPLTPLSLTCPARVEVTLNDGTELPVIYPTPPASGGRAPVTVTCGPASGSMFARGTSAVTCTAVDAAGQQATCAFDVTVTRPPRLSVTTFLAFGDSVTEGKLSLARNLLIDSPPHSYPAILTRLLQARYSAQDIRVLNDGWGGERTTEGRGRLDQAIRAHRPGAILLMHGINDLIGDGVPGVGRAADGLEELVKAAVASGARTFVATLPPLGPGPKASCRDECVVPYNERVRQIAAGKGAVLVDVRQAWGSRTGLMGADGIHPTAEGYEVIAGAFFDSIRSTLEVAEPAQ